MALAALVSIGPHNWHARAQTNRFVSPFGDDQSGANDCTSPDLPCKTIQHAVNQSGSGDLIELAPGTYTENVDVKNSVTIQGDFINSSTVNGNNTSPVFKIEQLDTNTAPLTATLSSLTITNGRASTLEGGGILNLGTLTVVQSTINGNTGDLGGAPGSGGGIYNQNTLTVINSTISGNSATLGGGGLFNQEGATATLVNATINGNTAGPSVGGGVDNNGGTLNLTNTIISGSSPGSGDCVNTGTIGTNSHNLVQDGSCSPAVTGNPKLGPLQNNGGPTFTHALMTGSPAIDAGDDSVLGSPLFLTTDQRGSGFPRKACAHVDIGAYEFNAGTAPTVNCPASIITNTDPGTTTATKSFTVTASDLCDGALTPVCAVNNTPITSPHAFPLGVTTVTCSATNSSGVTGSCSFTVSVSCLPPVVNCPANISVNTDPGKMTATVAFAATASDPCGGALTPVFKIGSTVITSPFAFPPGATTVTASATGVTGLTGSCSFTVTVNLLNICIQDDITHDTFRFNTQTGAYVYTRCRDKFMLTGTGTVRIIGSVVTLSDTRPDRRITANFLLNQLTGRAYITLIPAPGVSQTIVVNQTNPHATCTCP
jgi:hypothetical protein